MRVEELEIHDEAAAEYDAAFEWIWNAALNPPLASTRKYTELSRKSFPHPEVGHQESKTHDDS